jgi:hypothetical protein
MLGVLSRRSFRLVLGAAVLVVAGAVSAAAQFGFFGEQLVSIRNPRYDGRFTFARLKYNSDDTRSFYYCGLPAWAHGYTSCRGGERAEESLMKILNEISFLNPHIEESVVVGLSDPELFKYPVTYMTEPGFWSITDKEAAAYRAYLQKGGFTIFDDFRMSGDPRAGGGWENFEANIHKVLPEARIVDLDPSMPIFHSFFEIESFEIIPQMYDSGRPIFRGIFENNDPSKRLMVVVNYSTDVSDFWEFSATGIRPIDDSNQAYKLGVNYLMYGLTH